MSFNILVQPWILTLSIAVLLVLLVAYVPSYAQKLHTADYTITDFGLKDSSTPYITVRGKAGGSYDASIGDEGYQAYVFKTDKGNFIITVAEGSGNSPYYSADHLLSNNVKLNECLDTEPGKGKPAFHEKTVEYLGHNLNLTTVDQVYAIQVTLDDPDEDCETGEHVSKIFSQMGK